MKAQMSVEEMNGYVLRLLPQCSSDTSILAPSPEFVRALVSRGVDSDLAHRALVHTLSDLDAGLEIRPLASLMIPNTQRIVGC